ncbi:cisplatin damage response ATP-dependent DNA ligase [Xanthobacter sp. TB0136]|uniref:cisplatin damage response ATP-dependent DNA ligase n=1 Tax=Xanthobacter sp. TB0136 TaxID=3459177 RepID=UPI0040398778
MNRFAALVDRLSSEPEESARIRLVADYLRQRDDPARGHALALLAGEVTLPRISPAQLRTLIGTRVDPALLRLSQDFVRDLPETIALIWPQNGEAPPASPELMDITSALAQLPKPDLPSWLAARLDDLDDLGRWALLRLVTGGLRLENGPRLALGALKLMAPDKADELERIWPRLEPPYPGLLEWLEQGAPRPAPSRLAAFQPLKSAVPWLEQNSARLVAQEFLAEWKWNGLRVLLVQETGPDGGRISRLHTHEGEDITTAFPEFQALLPRDGAIDAQLMLVWNDRPGHLPRPPEDLRHRLNRKRPSAKLRADFPAHLRAFDLLSEAGEDLRPAPLHHRRSRLAAMVEHSSSPYLSLSPALDFSDWAELARHYHAPPLPEAISGIMLKHRQSPYAPSTAEPHWHAWKHRAETLDAVLLYVQHVPGAGMLCTFGLWARGEEGDMLVPVGKATLPETQASTSADPAAAVAHHTRTATINRFGPVREVRHEAESGLVLRIAHEGLARSARHRSGLTLRHPRIIAALPETPPMAADQLAPLQARLPSS